MNKKEIIEVTIPAEMSNYIEGLLYEVNARKSVITFCIEKNMDMNSEIFQKYHKDYVEFTAQYEMAKKEMEAEYISKKYPTAKWRLDFKTNTVFVEVE